MREIRRILCPVDLSDDSRHAVNHAVVVARWYDAAVTALHVYNPMVVPTISGFAVVGPYLPPPLTQTEIEEIHARVMSCFDSASGVRVDVFVEGGRPAPRILESARSLPADLIVIGTHGASGFEHLVLGSVTEKVLRQATCPVLTVPPHSRSTAKLPFKRILCPVDFSDSSVAAIDFALSLAQEGDAELTVVYVFEGWPDNESEAMRVYSIPEYRRDLEREITGKLQALIPDSTRDWCRPSVRLGYGKPYREILGMATEEAADLIVMGVHGRNALDLMLFGSTTNQVVRRATCPVLTLRQ
jgi:nucleotide-binding universal stress UspA family protein